jgi:hypothetical protein
MKLNKLKHKIKKITKLRNNRDILDIAFFIIVFGNLILTIHYNQTNKPNFELNDYKFDTEPTVYGSLHSNIIQEIKNDKNFDFYSDNFDYNKKQFPNFLYNIIFIDLTVTNTGNSSSSIKRIESNSIRIDNQKYDISIYSLSNSVFVIDDESKNLGEFVDFGNSKTKDIKVAIALPLIFSPDDYEIIDSLSKACLTKSDLSTKTIKNNSSIIEMKSSKKNNSNFLLHKKIYYQILDDSDISFRLIFYDQKDDKHSTKKIIIQREEDYNKLRLDNRGVVG